MNRNVADWAVVAVAILAAALRIFEESGSPSQEVCLRAQQELELEPGDVGLGDLDAKRGQPRVKIVSISLPNTGATAERIPALTAAIDRASNLLLVNQHANGGMTTLVARRA